MKVGNNLDQPNHIKCKNFLDEQGGLRCFNQIRQAAWQEHAIKCAEYSATRPSL